MTDDTRHNINNASANPYTLQVANIEWQNGVPVAKDFGDVYFSREDGLAESRHVFLHHNNLAQRWRELHALPPGTFTIIETGFGTGLNFLLAWQLWQQVAPPQWRLHYLSVEKHPLRFIDLQKAQQSWPELGRLASILQYNYPPLVPGRHRRLLNCEGVCLELLFGDANDSLAALVLAASPTGNSARSNDLAAAADAWFLDGFAPSQNPEMWQTGLLDHIAVLSKTGTSFATFTAVGAIRRGLIERGFSVEKVKGFGRKRDMLRGQKAAEATPFSPNPQAHSAPLHRSTKTQIAVPWHNPISTPINTPANTATHTRRSNRVSIIGAGLAGASTARALAARGYQVEVLERSAAPAQGASGNPQGVLYTKLSAEPGSLNHFTLSSFLHALAYYRPLIARNDIVGELCGVLQMATTEAEENLFKQLEALLQQQDWLEFVSPAQATKLAGIPLHAPAIHYPGAGWLSPPTLCQYWLKHDAISVRYNAEVANIQHQKSRWQLSDSRGKTLSQPEILIIANSHEAKKLALSDYLPIRPIRGQLSYLAPSDLAYQPKKVICHEGYFAPINDNRFCIGASFNLKDTHCELSEEEHQWNIQQLRRLSPELLNRSAAILGGRAALRCASPDYHPIVGPVPDVAKFDADYGRLRKDAKATINTVGRYQPALYLNVAHGSRGLTSTPICAELIASYICGEFSPLSRALCESLSPARFLIRDLKKRRR